jgi:hypothetical protein
MTYEFMIGRRNLHTNAVRQSHYDSRRYRRRDNSHKSRRRCCHAVTLPGNSPLTASGTAKLLTPLIKASLRNTLGLAESSHRQVRSFKTTEAITPAVPNRRINRTPHALVSR